MSNAHASAHRHTKESGEYPNIIAMRRNYSHAFKTSDRYQQCSDRLRRRRSVLATLDDLSGAPFSSTIFMYEEFLVNRKVLFLISRSYPIFSITLVPYLVMYITSYSIRIVLLSRYVNIYDTMAPMSIHYM